MRRARALVGAAAVIAGVLGAPAVAQAAEPLEAQVRCYPQGASVYDCYLTVTGGTAPYTESWSGVSGPTGRCRPNARYNVRVDVTDAAGATVTATTGFYCRGGPPI